MATPAPFEGIRVIDFGRYIAGPYCAALLGDLGADVIRVEKKEGREDRTLVPLAQNEDGTPREGAMFLQMNRNKRSMTCDPMNQAGRAVVRRLIADADVVVANLPAETLKTMGLDWDSVSRINPRAILAVGTAFGLEGPYSGRVGFDGVAQAMSGVWVYFSTAPKSSPFALAAAVCRLRHGVAPCAGCFPPRCVRATRRDSGQMVEGALLRTALTFFSPTLIEEDALKIGRIPSLNRSQTAGPSDIFKAKDGWITVAVNGDPLFRRACKLIGAPEWLDDPRFSSDKARGDNGEIISKRVGDWVAQRSSAEAIAAFEGARVPAGPVYRPRQTLDDPHVQAGDFFAEVDFPGIGKAKVAATPVKLHGTPGTVRRRPPVLGEHTDEVLRELGFSAMEIAVLKDEGAV